MADPFPPKPGPPVPPLVPRSRRGRLAEVAEVARLFLRLSLTAFGGPAAHIAMMEDEVVRRRRWITHDEFLDRLGAANLIPGPTSTEVVIYLGYLRAGWPGLVVAGICFIVPAAVMVACFAVLLIVAGAVLVAQFAPFAAASAQPRAVGLRALFLYFVKVGSVLYGSGYVLLAFLQQDLVGQWRWLTPKQLLDAVTVGQMTSGPLFTTATFIGYVLKGVPGAVAATLGIFLPSFVFCAISGPVMPWLRRSRLAGAFLDGVNVASLALMALVTWELARTALVDVLTIATALACAGLLYRFRVRAGWLALGGALWGLALACLP